MKPTPQPPFEGNLIRALDYAPCGCQEAPHWTLEADAEGELRARACPGRVAVEPFTAEDGAVLGYRLARR